MRSDFEQATGNPHQPITTYNKLNGQVLFLRRRCGSRTCKFECYAQKAKQRSRHLATAIQEMEAYRAYRQAEGDMPPVDSYTPRGNWLEIPDLTPAFTVLERDAWNRLRDRLKYRQAAGVRFNIGLVADHTPRYAVVVADSAIVEAPAETGRPPKEFPHLSPISGNRGDTNGAYIGKGRSAAKGIGGVMEDLIRAVPLGTHRAISGTLWTDPRPHYCPNRCGLQLKPVDQRRSDYLVYNITKRQGEKWCRWCGAEVMAVHVEAEKMDLTPAEAVAQLQEWARERSVSIREFEADRGVSLFQQGTTFDRLSPERFWESVKEALEVSEGKEAHEQ